MSFRRLLVRRRTNAARIILFFCVWVVAGCGARDDATSSGGAESAVERTAPPAAPIRRVEVVWPTPNPAFAEGRDLRTFIQPTVSGQVASGLFGSVRSGGRQFHEGIDLFPIERDRAGEALDPVFAVMAGVVKNVNPSPGASSYGRYVVLEHPGEKPEVYTLYAHLAAIGPGIAPGALVAAGDTLGRMGRSAGGYDIPKDRAHLHFEIGLRLTDAFQAWYDRRGFGSRNAQGLYNGMNLMGVDPLDFFARHQAGGLVSLEAIFKELPAALTLRIAHAGEPDFIRRYPVLESARPAGSPLMPPAGWEIDFSATGVPVRWRRLTAAEVLGWKRDEVRVLSVDQALLDANRGRKLIVKKRGQPAPASDLTTVLQLVFGLR